eukprot:1159209-Pelagomonas_calceolata.AAC.2
MSKIQKTLDFAAGLAGYMRHIGGKLLLFQASAPSLGTGKVGEQTRMKLRMMRTVRVQDNAEAKDDEDN